MPMKLGQMNGSNIMSKTMARPYAEALFEVASQTEQLDTCLTNLADLSQLAQTQAAFLSDPRLGPDDKVAVIHTALSNPLDCMKGFLMALAEKNRLPLLPEIAVLVKTAYDQARHQKEVHVHSPFPLSEALKSRLLTFLKTRYQERLVIIEHHEPSLIAGLHIQIGDDVIQASLSHQLSHLRQTLVTH